MLLSRARVQNYRSVRDTGWFDVEDHKTIFVGPNEAGKTAVLQALQQINPPAGVKPFDPLRDYPRAAYNTFSKGKLPASDVIVASAEFTLEEEDKALVPAEFGKCHFSVHRKLDNSATYEITGIPKLKTFGDIRKDLMRLAAHGDGRAAPSAEGEAPRETLSASLAVLTNGWAEDRVIDGATAIDIGQWLTSALPLIDEKNADEQSRYDGLQSTSMLPNRITQAVEALKPRLPLFVLYSNYFRVKPRIHLEHLATRTEQNVLDDAAYDYGNLCLLRLLGFTPRELSKLGQSADVPQGDQKALQAYQDRLDRRNYELNAASVRLTEELQAIWSPDAKRAEASKLRIVADGQYLKVVVEDELGVEIELDQRSEGFQWLVSFFVVFFAEAEGKNANAILLLDEPGLSLHGLKQREFRGTVSRLAEKNQTLFTTHSPFLVGPDELDLVRVVEMVDRRAGTKVHTEVTAEDPGALLPLQEALGYDMAQSLFSQTRNLILEGLTDFWYLESVSQLLRDAKIADMNEKIALVMAKSAGKVVYYATILHANKLKVAALLDSDSAGDDAAKQDVLVHTLGNKGILRTKDAYVGSVTKPEIEDLLRDTLVTVAKDDLGWDVSATATAQPARPIVDIFSDEITGFSKYKLAKAFVRWTRAHEAKDLSEAERKQWKNLINLVNKSLA